MFGHPSLRLIGEVSITPYNIYLVYQVEPVGALAPGMVGIDLNEDSFEYARDDGVCESRILRETAMVQKRHRRALERLDKKLPTNAKKRKRIVRRLARREHNRVKDRLVKAARWLVRKVVWDPRADAYRRVSFENLATTTQDLARYSRGKRRRVAVSRWPHGAFQRYVEERLPARAVIHVDSKGTSSVCPGCSSTVEHPVHVESVCRSCKRTYHRDGLAAVEILKRGKSAMGSTVVPECLAQLLGVCSVDGASQGPPSIEYLSDARNDEVVRNAPL